MRTRRRRFSRHRRRMSRFWSIVEASPYGQTQVLEMQGRGLVSYDNSVLKAAKNIGWVVIDMNKAAR